MSPELTRKVIDQLVKIVPTHGGDPDFLKEILMTALWVGWRNPELVDDPLLGLIEFFVRHAPAEKAARVLWRWMTMLDAIPDTRARYVAGTLAFLARPNSPDSDRVQEFLGSLLRLPVEDLSRHAEAVPNAAREHLAAGHVHRGFGYIELLSRTEHHGEAADLARDVSRVDPVAIYGADVNRPGPIADMLRAEHERLARDARLAEVLLRAEQFIAAGENVKARSLLSDELFSQEKIERQRQEN